LKPITVTELAHWLADAQRPKPVLLDVREPWEVQICRMADAQVMPMREVPTRFAELEPEQTVVCICHHGGRSAHVAMFLNRQGYGDVYNLTGGIDAWARQIDLAMATY
jgi:rhodanese-related sulfurtransferase